jgi:hypothetical protein
VEAVSEERRDAKSTLVVRGRVSGRLAGFLVLAAYLVPSLAAFGPVVVARFGVFDPERARDWVSHRFSPSTASALEVAVIAGGALAAVLTAAVTARLLLRRMGEVMVFELAGIVWNIEVPWWTIEGQRPDAFFVRWEDIQGYRDTPHPWIEILEENGRKHTIPAPTEAERLELLELLATKLPDLGLPLEERRRPQRQARP